MTMDDLIRFAEHAIVRRRSLSGRMEALTALAAIQSYLHEHDLLLGPDGLVRAEPAGAIGCSCPWDDNGTPIHHSHCKGSTAMFVLIPEEGT